MTRRRKDPLCTLTDDERRQHTRLSRATAIPAAHVARTTILLAVADGADYQTAGSGLNRGMSSCTTCCRATGYG